MIRKIYDADFGGAGVSFPYVVSIENKEESIVIECDCGAHMLKVHSNADIYKNSNDTTQVHQEIHLAMFSYGNGKRRFLQRIKIAWNYLRTGKMFSDQLCLTTTEAGKLANFINDNIIPTV